MADDNKTEKATPKKRKDAREKGNVCKSADLNSAFTITVMFWAVKTFGGNVINNIYKIMEKCITVFAAAGIDDRARLTPIFIEIGILFFLSIGPFLLISIIVGFASNYMQFGRVKVKDPLKPKWEKINPAKGFKRLISPKSLITMLKSILKFVILAYVAYSQAKKIIPKIPSIMQSELNVSIGFILDSIFSVAYKLGLAYIFIGIADFGYQKWSYEKGLRMTKQEVKDEYKMTEGDPKIKGKIKQKQQEISLSRMMAAVPKADVVITNPTHYAVALKYDEEKSGAPVVIAKGKDFTALKIKEKAAEHKIKMVENKPLAQALYATVEIGEEIPPEFYAAVAEILAEIYKLKRRK